MSDEKIKRFLHKCRVKAKDQERRDLFAAAALAGLLAANRATDDKLAQKAICYADEIMSELDKKDEKFKQSGTT